MLMSLKVNCGVILTIIITDESKVVCKTAVDPWSQFKGDCFNLSFYLKPIMKKRKIAHETLMRPGSSQTVELMRLFWNIVENEEFRCFWLSFLKILLAFYWEKIKKQNQDF